jgi:hypothetical protein
MRDNFLCRQFPVAVRSKEKISAILESEAYWARGLIAIRQDRKLGYMDLDGNIAIEPRYDQGGAFAEGLAAVQLEGHWMFIDKSGAVTAEFPAGVAFAERLSDGLSLVSADRDQSGRKFGYVDRNGHWAIKPSWDDAQPFHEGLA